MTHQDGWWGGVGGADSATPSNLTTGVERETALSFAGCCHLSRWRMCVRVAMDTWHLQAAVSHLPPPLPPWRTNPTQAGSRTHTPPGASSCWLWPAGSAMMDEAAAAAAVRACVCCVSQVLCSSRWCPPPHPHHHSPVPPSLSPAPWFQLASLLLLLPVMAPDPPTAFFPQNLLLLLLFSVSGRRPLLSLNRRGSLAANHRHR